MHYHYNSTTPQHYTLNTTYLTIGSNLNRLSQQLGVIEEDDITGRQSQWEILQRLSIKRQHAVPFVIYLLKDDVYLSQRRSFGRLCGSFK